MSDALPPHLAFIDEALQKRSQSLQLRSIPVSSGQAQIRFDSNDYLGLGALEVQLEGLSSSSSSRLLAGNSEFLEAAEKQIALAYPASKVATLFPSTFQLNTSIIPALVGRQDIVIADKYIHNSLLQGIKLSQAKLFRYAHNDLSDAERLLQRYAGQGRRCLMITESVFSMHGSMSDLTHFIELARKYKAISLVDEAHAYGVFGPKGMGRSSVEFFPDLLVGALGKAAGAMGGFVVTDSSLKHYFANFAAGMIYSTALPPIYAEHIKQQVSRMQAADDQRSRLQQRIQFTINALRDAGYALDDTSSPINSIFMQSEQKVLKVKTVLAKQGIAVAAIRPPTIPAGQSCIRISLSANHLEEDVDMLILHLKAFL